MTYFGLRINAKETTSREIRKRRHFNMSIARFRGIRAKFSLLVLQMQNFAPGNCEERHVYGLTFVMTLFLGC